MSPLTQFLSAISPSEAYTMRCTRCDGYAVPQAVGVADDGRVVFGWCPRCLVETRCEIVDIGAKGIRDLGLKFKPVDFDNSSRRPSTLVEMSAIEQSVWIAGAVGFLMVTWGMAVIGAGLLMSGLPAAPRNPLPNGSPPALRVGGTVTILLGVLFLTMAATRNRNFRRGLTHLVRWGGLIVSVLISCYAIASGGIYRSPLPVGWAICLPLILSVLAYVLDEALNGPSKPVNPWEFPVVFYSETPYPEKPRNRI